MKKIPSSEITPEQLFLSRRQFMGAAASLSAAALLAACGAQATTTPASEAAPADTRTEGHSTGSPDSLTIATPSLPPPEVPGYELAEEIGHGGMGVVYRARDLALNRDVAVKILHDKYSPTSLAARRFLDEARITGQLQHPGIPPVHQVGTLAGGPHPPRGHRVAPRQHTGRQEEPGLRVGLDDVRRRTARVAWTGHRLDGTVRRNPHLDGVPGREIG